MRSSNEPPSRIAPAFSITLPSGLRMSVLAGFPSIQNAHSSGLMNCFAVSSTGEYAGAIFTVVGIALLASWLVAGMFLFGCGLRILDECTDLRRSVHGAFLMLLLFPTIVMAGTDCATLLAGIPGMVILSLAVVAVSFKRRTATAG